MEFVRLAFFVLTLLICKCASENYDKENLKKLTEYRQQHRKTVDGRLCAAAFVQDDQTYTDCTKATDPNGITGREWCYVEVQLVGKGNRDWDYCRGVINYDIVRSKGRTFFQAKSNELSNAVTKLDLEHKKLGGIYEKYEEICGTTSELLKKKIEEINDIAKNSSRNINRLLLQASSIGEMETKLYELEDEVKKNRKEFLENKKNCSISKGYTIEDRADGLIGSYYDNAYFSGYPISINNDKYINFVWDTGVPVENIPYQHFSIRWDGYLKIPQTDNYVITIEHDCGIRIFLDNTPIIIENMPYPKEEESEEMRPISVLPFEKINTKVQKSSSKKLGLIGGKKYKIRVEYFHLSTIKYENPDNAHIILYWKSDNITEEIIPSNFFFQGNVTTPLRITQLQGDEYEIIFLENGAYAFMDSTNFIIADIPTIYENSKAIRSILHFNKNEIRFRVNTYSTVYIAIPKEEKNIPMNNVTMKIFVPTKETISIYKIEQTNKNASEQKTYNLYSSLYNEGEVVVKLEKPTPFFMFLIQSELQTEDSCRGYMQVVSLTNSEHFYSCYASSYESDKFNCNAGFSGDNKEKEYATWKTATSKSLGQYMSINFKYEIDIYSFTFKTLQSIGNDITELSLYFPNRKNPEIFSINPGHHHYKLKIPVKTKMVKVVISRVNDTKYQTGGNIAFYGIPCINSTNIEKHFEKRNQYEISIYFKSKNISISSKPLNWLVDNGGKKQTHGYVTYGWEKIPTPIEWEELDKKDLSHSGISFSPLECKGRYDVCDISNTWSIDLLHEGKYYVAVEIGSPSGKQELNSIKLNGEMFINNIFLKPKQYTKVTADVVVGKEKTLQISTNTKTVIQSVQLLFLHKESGDAARAAKCPVDGAHRVARRK
ncbi:LCCL domain-containing protein (LAP5) [Plasmodium ovale curtisi]|uniref:LCCL domain-containing protein (LAP5) n=1 Tax=Plasmodium ovale curtisi TaxID=864141 RepID=A0A1A8WXF3_PLAOA|nr:LCCL domain-containing protein (LAP5) [Plasmodium ovale curtisi]